MSRTLLMVGTRKGAFLLESNADRTDWEVRGPLMKGWEVSDLYLDRRGETERLFAAVGHFVYGPTIQVSEDLGDSWEPVEEGPAFPEEAERELKQIWTVVPGSKNEPETLYAGVADAGLFVSRDGGDRWEEVLGLTEHPTRERWFPGLGGMCVHSILPHPDDPDRIWIGISSVGVFYTGDGGDNWELRNDGLDIVAEDEQRDDLGSCIHRLVFDPEDPETLYQQNHRGVFRSRDGAASWQRVEEGLPTTFGFPMALHPRDRQTIYTVPLESDEFRMTIDGQMAVYRSRDGADSWEPLTDGLPDDCWATVLRQALAVDPLSPAGVYVGTTGGALFASRDEGDSWSRLPCDLPRIYSINAVEVD